MKKPSVPKCFGGSQKIFLGCSTSSLAVFYVEQVALNRHVRRNRGSSIYGTNAGNCQYYFKMPKAPDNNSMGLCVIVEVR
jgi:hypothetical protein